MSSNVSKNEWVDMFREIGLTEETMMKWHQLFESRHPDGHAAFLQWLGIPADEIADIRTRSK
ncbi:hypothetical protein [Desulfosarcina ovata]|uniref:Uncharacterized protein n=1 Tax=Desulfosarcina ovata subsp. ovata TaxID=2752305 RepID=A0A5K8AFE3_9BACT|nr:hypothetical protein [Desulfosarcina ovata]BBO90630.1 hypothetical protein DSCOOX_38100 [Desulfosarcina ovata subsp. ovata]